MRQLSRKYVAYGMREGAEIESRYRGTFESSIIAIAIYKQEGATGPNGKEIPTKLLRQETEVFGLFSGS